MPATVPPRLATGAAIRLRRLSLIALAAAALATCTGEPTAPGRPGVGTLRVAPQFDAFARLVPLTLDNVRVIVVRPPSTVILTATRSFSASSQQLTLSLPVLLQSSSEALQVTLELYAGTTLLFSGTSTVQVAAGGTTAPATVPVVYQGPGATLASLTLAPRDTTVSLGASFPFTATAQDAQQVNVPQFYVSWSADNGSIDAAGMFTAPGARDTVMVNAVTPNGVEDSTRVIVTAAPSTLTKVGGDGQSGIVGTRLPQPLAVQVNGTDGQPVPGAVVAFTVTTGGGSVDSAVATSDAQGIARSGAVLGLTVGQQSFTATVSGIPAAVFTATATGVAPIVVTLAAGGNHTCEIRGTQTLCWGDNSTGQLGDGTTTDRAVPGPVATAQTFVSLALGDGHSCALTAAGQAFCWGENFSGSLGDGTTTGSPTPVAVSGGRTFVALSAGEEFTCGLTAAGQAFCWGYNFDGQLGDGGNSDQLVPVPVTGGLSFTSLDAGTDHACALTAAGQAFCWGSNFDGQLGDGTLVSQNVPTAVTGGLIFSALHAGFNFSCGLDTSGAGFCWGINFGIQLTSPQPVAGGFTYTAIAGGDNHICGLTTGGWRCGGDNGSGQLGDGTTTDRVSPVLPSGGFTFSALAGGSQHTCGRTSSGTRCWGSNTVGQLGDGSNTDQLTPTMSVGPATTAAVSAGNGQTASAGTAVPIAPAIVVRDGLSNPVPGLDVIFAVTNGGGSLTGAVTQTDALGIATVGSWTLGATPGSNTLSATVQVGGVSGNPVSFTATGTSPSVLTWNGSVSTAWTTAANWTPALVPTAAQDVVIPSGTPNQPLVTTTASTQSLAIQSGATLTLNGSFTFNVFGDFDNSGTIALAAGTPTLDLRGTTRTLQGNSPLITSVSGSYTLTGTFTVPNALSISGGTGSLTVGGQLLSVSSLSVGSGGSLVMTNPADVVVVSGNLTMGGSDHTGKLTAGQIQVQGNFLQSSGGSVNSFAASGTHSVIMTGVGSSMNFQSPGAAASRFNDLSLAAGASASLASRVVVGGSVFTTGTLTLAGHTLEVIGDLVVLQNAGSRLVMTNVLDSLLVSGNASFDGGSELTFMSAGVLVVGGNLTQQNAISPDAFHPSGTHKTVLTGNNPTLSFATPGNVPGTSHFETVEWSGTGTLTLASNVFAHGAFQSLGAGASSIASVNTVLDVGGFSAAGPMTFNGTTLRLDMPSGGPLALGNLTFQSMSSTVNQLEVLHPGTGGPFTFTNLSFSSVPTTGRYLVATDADGGTPVALTIDMVAPTPATDGGFKQEANGAVINWPAAAPGFTWTGAVNTDWHTAGNWSTGSVPNALSNVLIPAGPTNQPVMSAAATTDDLTIQSGASLDVGGFLLVVGGNLDATGAISGPPGSQVSMAGAFGTILGAVLTDVAISANTTVAGTTVVGSLAVAATFNLNSNVVQVSGDFSTSSGALVVMQSSGDGLVVGGNATWDGNNQLGFMSAGTIQFAGNFTQLNSNSDDSFHPSGTHLALFTSLNPTISFASPGDAPGTSHFQEISWPLTGGTMTLATDVFAHGMFSGSGSVVGTITSSSGRTLHAGGFSSAGTVFDNVQLVLHQASATILDLQDVTFLNINPTAVALTTEHNGVPSASPLTYTNISFNYTPTAGGFYLRATDLASDGNPLFIDMVNPLPATPGAFVDEVNGATINWPSAITWNGSVDTDWFNTANWNGGVVPGPTDNVLIPSGMPNYPAAGNISIQDLTIQPGATLGTTDHTITVGGNLDASGVLGGPTACCDVQMTGTGVTARGNLEGYTFRVQAGAVVSLNGSLTIGGPFTDLIDVNGGELIVNGQTAVADEIQMSNGGLLTMTNPADQVNVDRALFNGGDETGRLTAGTLSTRVLLQTVGTSGHATSFFASGSHQTTMTGSSAGAIGFASAPSSRFQSLMFGAIGSVDLSSDVTAAGQLISLQTSGNGPTITTSAPGSVLTAGGADIVALASFTALTLDGVPLVLSGGGVPVSLSDVIFQNQNPLGTHLTVNNVGTPSAFIFGNLNFTTGLSAGGFYIVANDLDGATPDALTIDVVGSNPASGTGVSQANNGAIINWPAAGASITWSGSASVDWFDPANWVGGIVPTSLDNVIIGPAGNQPLLTNNAGANDLTVQVGATVEVGDFVLVLNGNVDAAGSIEDVTGTGNGGVTLTGIATPVRGTINTTVAVNGNVTMNGNLTTGDLSLFGSLAVSGNSLTIQGNLSTGGAAGVLVMTNAADNASTSGSAFFTGGSTDGLLINGVLTIGGDLFQVATNSVTSFAPSGNHTTVFNGATLQSVDITSPGSGAAGSHFHNLDLSSATGGVSLGVNAIADQVISTNTSATLIGAGNSLTMRRAAISGLTVDHAPLLLDEQGVFAAENLSNITFQNFPTSGTTMLNIVGPGGTVSARPAVTTTNMTFQPLPIGAGNLYLKLVSTNGGFFTLTMTGSNQSPGQGGNGPALSDPANQQTIGGATILWP